MTQADKPGERTHERPRSWTMMVLFVLLSATFLNYSNRFTFTQNATTIQQTFEVTDYEYGYAAGMFALGFAMGGLLFGILADRISVRWLYPIVVVVFSVAGILSGVVTSLFGFFVCRYILGIFEAGHWPCALRTTQRIFKPDQRTWGNSVLQSGASLGAVATPLLVLGLLNVNSDPASGTWRLAFYLVGGLGVPWAIWWLLTIRESDVRRPVIQTDEDDLGAGKEQHLQEIPFHRVFLTRRWWLLLIIVICINTVWHYIRVWMPVTLAKDHGYSSEFIQLFTSLYYLSTFFGSLASGWLVVHLSRRGWNVHRSRVATFLVFAVLSSMSIPAAFMPRGPLLLGSLLIVAFGSLGLFPIYYSLNQEISAKNQGKVGGTLGFCTWSILYFVHPAVGNLVTRFPDIRPYLFAGVGIGPMIAFFVLAFLWGKRPTAAHNEDTKDIDSRD